jgi:hypothetical protein
MVATNGMQYQSQINNTTKMNTTNIFDIKSVVQRRPSSQGRRLSVSSDQKLGHLANRPSSQGICLSVVSDLVKEFRNQRDETEKMSNQDVNVCPQPINGFYFPEEIWNIIKEYNGIVGWDKSFIYFINKSSFPELHSVLTSTGIFDKYYTLFYLETKGTTSRRQLRKILIQLFFTTNPSKSKDKIFIKLFATYPIKDKIFDLYEDYFLEKNSKVLNPSTGRYVNVGGAVDRKFNLSNIY